VAGATGLDRSRPSRHPPGLGEEGNVVEPRSLEGVLACLRAGEGIDRWDDLCVYPSGDLFVVECYVGDLPVDVGGLTPAQAEQLLEEEELAEAFDTPEEAAALYLKLWEKYGKLLGPPAEAPRPPAAAAAPAGDAAALPDVREAGSP
jgi:hypothetical protein